MKKELFIARVVTEFLFFCVGVAMVAYGIRMMMA
jgi:hypothetical protein